MDRYHQEISLQRKVEYAVDAWFDLDRKQRQLSAFKAENPRPKTPSRFDSVDDVLGYNTRKDDYETQLGLHVVAVERAQKTLYSMSLELSPSEGVSQSLPEGVPLMFTYQAFGHPWGGGKKYEIVRTPEGDQPSIKIRELED